MKPSKKVKVLHVVGAMNRAGTETMLMNFYRHMDHDKFQFDFVSYDKGIADYDEEIESLNGTIIKLTKTSSIKQLFAAIKKYGPYDVVHAHTLFHSGIVNLAAFLAGVKIRITHAHTTTDKSSFSRKIYMTTMRFLINTFSTTLLACSKEAGLFVFGKESVKKEKYSYFPNAIDYAAFLQPTEIDVENFKLEEGLENQSIVIGHIGTFKTSKNHMFLLSIMERLVEKEPAITLLFVGDGELRQSIQEKAQQQGLMDNVKFLGVRKDIQTLLHSMDVFVFPSIYEGLGLVLLEAQASGVPCIVSEAIQPEADLGFGLVEKLPLAEGSEIWAERIIQSVGKKEKNTNKIMSHFEKSGYSLTNGMAILQKIYNYKEETDEKEDVNRLF